MSRLIGHPASVVTASSGAPILVNGAEVLHVHETYRQWIGALQGRPEVDVWHVETSQGILELHNVVNSTTWTIERQAD